MSFYAKLGDLNAVRKADAGVFRAAGDPPDGAFVQSILTDLDETGMNDPRPLPKVVDRPNPILGYEKRPTYPRQFTQVADPLRGYTGEFRKALIKGPMPTEERQYPFTQGHTGYKPMSEHKYQPVTHPKDKLPGYAGFANRQAREEANIAT